MPVNGANEQEVALLLEGKLGFNDIGRCVNFVLDSLNAIGRHLYPRAGIGNRPCRAGAGAGILPGKSRIVYRGGMPLFCFDRKMRGFV